MKFIEENRSEILADARAKRERVLRIASTGDAEEEARWLRVAGRMTEWIEQLEQCAETEERR